MRCGSTRPRRHSAGAAPGRPAPAVRRVRRRLHRRRRTRRSGPARRRVIDDRARSSSSATCCSTSTGSARRRATSPGGAGSRARPVVTGRPSRRGRAGRPARRASTDRPVVLIAPFADDAAGAPDPGVCSTDACELVADPWRRQHAGEDRGCGSATTPSPDSTRAQPAAGSVTACPTARRSPERRRRGPGHRLRRRGHDDPRLRTALNAAEPVGPGAVGSASAGRGSGRRPPVGHAERGRTATSAERPGQPAASGSLARSGTSAPLARWRPDGLMRQWLVGRRCV